MYIPLNYFFFFNLDVNNHVKYKTTLLSFPLIASKNL